MAVNRVKTAVLHHDLAQKVLSQRRIVQKRGQRKGPVAKANQFLGMEPLPTFIANDVIKMPDVPRYTEEYRKHLVEIFG